MPGYVPQSPPAHISSTHLMRPENRVGYIRLSRFIATTATEFRRALGELKKEGMEELTKVSHKLAEEIYKQAASAKQQKSQNGQAASGSQQDTAEEPGPAGGKKDEDIIDAEYKEEDQDGKK